MASGPFIMENQNERNVLRRVELMNKHRDIIAKAAREMELERERELRRIAKAKRDAAASEQNLLNSDEMEQARKNNSSASREQLRLNRAARRASRLAASAVKKTVQIADVTGLHSVQETEDDLREVLQSIN